MPGRLTEYWKKRDFGVTSEPRGTVARPGKALSFVVQKHAASRLHYDFRLELDGTLVSWAVPKGPSLDPKVKRMAVHVEDHPISYGTFEGVIPEGQYGAGTVIVWDRGTWEPVGDPRAGYKAGKLKFDLHGEKLQGRWNLVRMKARAGERQEPWLLMKDDDDEARPIADYDVTEAEPYSVVTGNPVENPAAKARKAAKPKAKASKTAATKAKAKPRAKKTGTGEGARGNALPPQAVPARLPLAFAPQLATLVQDVPTGPGWIYELKFDGYRVLARIEGDDVRLFTRNGNDWTSKMPQLRDAVAKLGIASAWIDGEVVVLNEKGQPDFQRLQNAFDARRPAGFVYFVFDLPHYAGHDLTAAPLVERRRILEKAVDANASPLVRFSTHVEGTGSRLLASACDRGLEGLIGKRADAPYSSRRTGSWIKLKCNRRQEFVIAGYTDPRGSRTGFGSLLLGVHDKAGRLVYAGNVGTGFDHKGLDALHAKLEKIATDKSPFDPVPRGVKGHWVRPKLVAEVSFTEWTSEGRIRHPVFHGLRDDKEPRAITREPVKTLARPRTRSAPRRAR